MANNYPIAIDKHIAAMDVDSYNLVGVAATGTTLYNGTLVTLGAMNQTGGASAGMGYTFTVAPTTANTDTGVCMVLTPPVNADIPQAVYTDPREFSVPAGRPCDIVRLVPGDFIQVSDTAFATGAVASSTKTYVTAAANGQYSASASVVSAGSLQLRWIASEPILVGHDSVPAEILMVVANPLA